MGPSQRHPKSARLRRPLEFRAVLDRAEVFPGRQALVRRLCRAQGPARLGVNVPRGYGGAVRRNRFRRLAREAFRTLDPTPRAMDLLLSPRRGLEEPSLEGLRADIARAARAPVRESGAGTRERS